MSMYYSAIKVSVPPWAYITVQLKYMYLHEHELQVKYLYLHEHVLQCN